MNGSRNFVFFSTTVLLPRKLTTYRLWLSDWSSPAFQQLSGITQTCATRSLGMVWKTRGCACEGAELCSWGASDDVSGQEPRPLGRFQSWVWPLCVGCCAAWTCGPTAALENGSSLYLGVPSPLSFLLPTWGDRFSFSLVMVTLSLAKENKFQVEPCLPHT